MIFICSCVRLKQKDFKTDFSAVIIPRSFALHCCVTVACGELGGSLRFRSPGPPWFPLAKGSSVQAEAEDSNACALALRSPDISLAKPFMCWLEAADVMLPPL